MEDKETLITTIEQKIQLVAAHFEKLTKDYVQDSFIERNAQRLQTMTQIVTVLKDGNVTQENADTLESLILVVCGEIRLLMVLPDGMSPENKRGEAIDVLIKLKKVCGLYSRHAAIER